MSIIREHRACVLVVLSLAAFVFVACGIGYLVNPIDTILVRALHAIARPPYLRPHVEMSFRRRILISGTEPTIIGDCLVMKTPGMRISASWPGYLSKIILLLMLPTIVHARQATPSLPRDDGYRMSVSVDEVVL